MILRTMTRLHFPADAMEVLQSACDSMLGNRAVRALLAEAEEMLFFGEEKKFLVPLEKIPTICDVDRRTSDMVWLLLCAEPLRLLYRERKISEQIWVDTMSDLRYKLMECYKTYGVWGTFVTSWYGNFYRLGRFALGRLQYEKKPFRFEEGMCYRGLVRAGDLVLHTHIPSSGPLLYEDVMDSLRRAYDFYREDLREGKLVFDCSSWLLYPPYFKTVFAEGSNLHRFGSLFDVIQEKEDTEYADFWRVFGLPYSDENLLAAPTDTSLRRRMKDYLLSGGKMGSGYGVILFDGEKII